MKYTILSLFYILIFAVILNGCASKMSHIEQQKLNVYITPNPPIVIQHKNEAQKLIESIDFSKLKKVGEISLLDIPIFNRLDEMESFPLSRAYAIGYPNRCGSSYHAWNYETPQEAAIDVLKNALDHAKTRERHISQGCGAQLVLVDNNLLVSPEDLPKSFFVNYVLRRKIKGEETIYSYGIFEHEGTGENLTTKIYANDGKIICQGTYSLGILQAIVSSGEMVLKCFDNTLEVHGELEIKNVELKHKSGSRRIAIGKGTDSNGNPFDFYTGISIDHFDHYKDLFD